MMDAMQKLLEQEQKTQEKLKKIQKDKEEIEKKIIAKIPSVLKEKYPQIYDEIKEMVISKPILKKAQTIKDDKKNEK